MINIFKRLLNVLQVEEDENVKKKPSRFIVWLIIFAVIALILIMGYFFFWRTEAGFSLDIGSWISAGWSRLWQTVTGIRKQAMGLGEWGPYISPEEKKEPKGVEITKISFQKPFLPGQDMFIFSEGKVYALDKPTNVEFKCSRDGKEGIIEQDTLYVENVDVPFGVRCDFGETPKVDKIEYSKVMFSTTYNDFETNARLKLYTLSKSKLEELSGVNPFDYFEVPTEPILDKNKRITRTDCGYGKTICEPLSIDMRVFALQPLSDGEYTLKIETNIDSFWGGKLVKDRLGVLELDFFGNIRPEGDTIFELTSKNKQTYYCNFVLMGAEEDISAVEIRAKAVYDYEFSKEDTITIASKEAMEA